MIFSSYLELQPHRPQMPGKDEIYISSSHVAH